MLVCTFIFFSVVALFFLITGFLLYPKNNSELFFGVAVILFSVLAYAGIALETLEPQYDATGGFYYVASQIHVDYSMMGINLMFVGISILFFFIDILEKYIRKKGKDA